MFWPTSKWFPPTPNFDRFKLQQTEAHLEKLLGMSDDNRFYKSDEITTRPSSDKHQRKQHMELANQIDPQISIKQTSDPVFEVHLTVISLIIFPPPKQHNQPKFKTKQTKHQTPPLSPKHQTKTQPTDAPGTLQRRAPAGGCAPPG